MERSEFYSAMGMAWVLSWAVILLVAWHLQSKRRQRKEEWIHQERMKAMEKGIPLPELPALEENGARKTRIWNDPVNPRWLLGAAALLITGGFGTSLALYLSGEAYHNRVWPFGLIGVFLGIGLVLHYWLTRKPEA
ncbi:MAG: hypothetical protein FJW35_02655 [Acidobacteria bacterium]|nr:hypothetical protein [Acidobacteriota bacterium]